MKDLLILYKKAMYNQFDQIRIENTNACGYHCQMCPREKQTRKIGHMSFDDFTFLTSNFPNFRGQVHLHGFGESLLDRTLSEKIAHLKSQSPKSTAHLISTLGVRVKDTYFEALLASGLDTLIISLYGYTPSTYKELHGFDGFERVKHNLSLLSKAKKKHPKHRAYVKLIHENINSPLPVAGQAPRLAFEAFLRSLEFDIGYLPNLHNFGDGRSYNEPSNKPCPVLEGDRHRTLQITWDLNVVPCCFDYNSSIVFGNLREQSLEEIFNSPPYLQFLLSHRITNGHDFAICRTCERGDTF